MKKIGKILAILFVAIIFQTSANQALAQCFCAETEKEYDQTACEGRPSSERCVWKTENGSGASTCSGDSCPNLKNPLNINTPQQFIGRVISVIFGLVGSIALLMFVYGGLLWMTSQGNDKQITKGKETLTWAAIGIVVIFSSYALVNYIINHAIRGS
jgi:hypothetical protein